MSAANMDLLKLYKRTLPVYISIENYDEVLRILKRISDMELTMDMVIDSGIEKVVNELATQPGKVGEYLSIIKRRWAELLPQKAAENVKHEMENLDETSLETPETSAKQENHFPKIRVTLKRISDSPSKCRPPAKRPRIEKDNSNIKSLFFDAFDGKTEVISSLESHIQNSLCVEVESSFQENVIREMKSICASLEKEENEALVVESGAEFRKISTKTMYIGSKGSSTGKEESLISKFQRLVKAKSNKVKCIKNIPYEILVPIIREFDPLRLEAFEKNNPTLCSNTDDLWKRHVLKKYPNNIPDKVRNWRELYFRKEEIFNAQLMICSLEMSAKYENIKKNCEIKTNDHPAPPPPSAKKSRKTPANANKSKNAKKGQSKLAQLRRQLR